MKTVWKEMKHDKFSTILLFVWLAFSTAYSVFNLRFVVLVSNALSEPTEIQKHLVIIGVVTLIQIVNSGVVNFVRPLIAHHLFGSINDRYADKVLDADVEMFTKFSCAHISTVAEHIFHIAGIPMDLVKIMNHTVYLVMTLVTMYQIGGTLIIPIMVVYLIGAWLLKYLHKKYTEIDTECDNIKKARNQEMENAINGFAEIRTFNRVEFFRNVIHTMNENIWGRRIARSKVQSVTNSAFITIDGVGTLIVIIYSMIQLSNGSINQAEAMSLIMLVFRIIDPLLDIMADIDDISQRLAKVEPFREIMEYENKMTDGTIELMEFNKSIVLDHVSFSYDKSSEVLNAINMEFKKGQHIGICGASGGGKTTIFKLLNKFYGPTGGIIRVDGLNIRSITNSSYRKFVGSVHQDTIIFPGSIRDNIMYANEHATEDEFMDAVKRSNVYEFVKKLPERFDTHVGPRGLKLSGGQKQRIALARLFLQDPDIILLDEATSALDNESESLIQEAIDNLAGKTVITIAHRLSTIKNSDLIYVVGDQGVLESGTDAELMALKGAYYKMVTSKEEPV